MTDFAALSDEELSATLILLGEQAQEVTNATALVRSEQQRRAMAPAVELGEVGTSVLAECMSAAPARAAQIAAEAEAADGG